MVWTQPLWLTLQLIFVSVTIAAVLGIVGAWAGSVLESGRRLQRIVAVVLMVSMVIAVAMPIVLHAAAWESTAGKFGWMFLTQTGARGERGGAYGFFAGLIACGWIHGLVGAAITTLVTWHGVRRTPPPIVQQSHLDVGPIAAWWKVRLPMAAPWLAAGLLGTALLAATEMTVVDLYGYRTVADEFYLFYAVDPSIPAVMMTCVLPLLIAGGLLTWLMISGRRRVTAQGRLRGEASMQEDLPRVYRGMACAAAIALAGLVVIVPLAGLVIKLGHDVTLQDDVVSASWSASESVDRLFSAPSYFADEYQWTALIAALTGLAAVAIAWPLAAIGRARRWLERWIDMATVLLFVIPGPIIGLWVVTVFQADLPGFRMLYQQSLLPSILALLARAVPVAYWVLRSAYRSIGTSVFEAARLDQLWPRRVWFVHRPLLQSYLWVSVLAAGVVASGDVPAQLPVLPPGVTTVGTRLFGLLHSGARYQEAALAIWYVAAVVVISLILIGQLFIRRGKLE